MIQFPIELSGVAALSDHAARATFWIRIIQRIKNAAMVAGAGGNLGGDANAAKDTLATLHENLMSVQDLPNFPGGFLTAHRRLQLLTA